MPRFRPAEPLRYETSTPFVRGHFEIAVKPIYPPPSHDWRGTRKRARLGLRETAKALGTTAASLTALETGAAEFVDEGDRDRVWVRLLALAAGVDRA